MNQDATRVWPGLGCVMPKARMKALARKSMNFIGYGCDGSPIFDGRIESGASASIGTDVLLVLATMGLGAYTGRAQMFFKEI